MSFYSPSYYTMRPRKRLRLRRGRLVFIALLLALMVVIVFGVRFLNSFQRMQNQEPWAQALREAHTDQGINYLLFGVTQREGGFFADQILLYNVMEGRALPNIVFLPGETVVDLSCYGPGTLGGAFAQGGSQLLLEAVMEFLSVPVHHYVKINYEVVPVLVDEMGGVNLKDHLLEAEDFYDYFLQQNVSEPLQILTRRREAAGLLLSSLAGRYSSRHVPGLVRKCSPYVETDLNWKELVSFYKKSLPLYEKDTVVVNFPGRWEEAYFFPDEDTYSLLIGRLGKELLLPREQISVEVLNGSGVEGIAALVGDWLAEQGFNIGNVGNADHFEYTRTIVIGRTDDMDYAREVALFIPGVELHKEPLEEYKYMVTVILGHNFDPASITNRTREELREDHAD